MPRLLTDSQTLLPFIFFLVLARYILLLFLGAFLKHFKSNKKEETNNRNKEGREKME